jgi:predicted transcriptional regulator
MNKQKEKLKKDLELIHRHLTRAEVVMEKIATKLGIDRHEYLEKTLYEVEELLKMFEDNGPPKTH